MKIRFTSGIGLGLLLLCLISFEYAGAQISVKRIAPGSGKPSRDGFVFALPQTVVKVTVSVKEIDLVKGPYAEYADEYLGIKNPVMSNGKEYELLDVQLSTISQPDPAQLFFAEVDERTSKEERNIFFLLAGNGILKGVNSGVQAINEPGSEKVVNKHFSNTELFPFATSPSRFQKTDTIIRIVTVDTASVKKRFFKTSFDEKPSEQKAREAADMVARLREGLVNLLTGFQEISYDPATLKFMTDNIQNLREEYISMFKGLRLEKVVQHTYYIVPSDDQSSMATTVCKFSKEFGVSEQGDAKARDITLHFKRDATTSAVGGYVPKGNLSERSSVVFYRIPESTQIVAKFQGQVLESIHVPVAQFGAVVPVSLSKTHIELDENTGALKSVFFE
jgi:hypothetical protein